MNRVSKVLSFATEHGFLFLCAAVEGHAKNRLGGRRSQPEEFPQKSELSLRGSRDGESEPSLRAYLFSLLPVLLPRRKREKTSANHHGSVSLRHRIEEKTVLALKRRGRVGDDVSCHALRAWAGCLDSWWGLLGTWGKCPAQLRNGTSLQKSTRFLWEYELRPWDSLSVACMSIVFCSVTSVCS